MLASDEVELVELDVDDVVVPLLINFAIGSDEDTVEEVAMRRILLDEVVECAPIDAGQNRGADGGRCRQRSAVRLGRIDSAELSVPS
jgi:hypothetical protein